MAETTVLGTIYGADDYPCCEEDIEEECKANARLIAAAPDLLAACESITLLADPALYGAPRDIRAKYVEFHNKIMAAIAKAKGQTE